MTSHCDGEVWGLEIVTLDDGSLRILTSADDNRILAYNGGAAPGAAVAECCWGSSDPILFLFEESSYLDH